MKTEIKEIQVTHEGFNAIVRDGGVTNFESIGTICPDIEKIKAYIIFCKETIEAVKETQIYGW